LNLSEVPKAAPKDWSNQDLEAFLRTAVRITEQDRKEFQIKFYQPVSPKSQTFHDSKAKVVAAGGGNGSSKTETMLVDMVMCMTGMFPDSQRHLIDQKFRGPINCRLTVESLTTTLEPIILPKLQWFRWTGVDRPGGEKGHWGWIPKNCLIDGEWDRSWSNKLRILRVLCRDPRNPDKVLGESTLQCMSIDQDSTDFASGDFHICAHDEPPSLPIWRENEARTMRVDGRMLLAMTWPDDPSIAVDWLYDEVYEPGRSGSDPSITWIELWTTENRHLKQEAVSAQAQKWSAEIANVRIYGKPIRFSNRVHAEFTDNTKTWCFPCGKAVVKVPGQTLKPLCGICGTDFIVDYKHVEDFPHSSTWPTVFLLDPHPRKPHMWMWVQIDPADDWWITAEGKLEGDCVEVRDAVLKAEKEFGFYIARRLMDPNMGASPSGQRREVTWQDEFASAGLGCELASDVDVGRSRINQFLKPDQQTLRPRLKIHERCKDTIYQFNRYSWAEFSKNVDRDQKQTPKDRNDDFPTLTKYLANSDPVFNFLRGGAPVLHRPGQRKGSY
jgi:hypothetical protein